MTGYITVKLPTDLVKELDKFVGTLGFRSRSEIIKQAIREYLFVLRRETGER